MSRADNGGFRGIAPISKADSIRNEPHPNEAEAGTITPCNLSRYRIFTTLLPNSRSQQKRCDVYHLLVNDALGSIRDRGQIVGVSPGAERVSDVRAFSP